MRQLLIFLIVSIASVSALATSAAVPTGQWRYAGGATETARVQEVVDAVVAELSFLLRPIARPRLKKECAPWMTLRIQHDGSLVTVHSDDGTFTSAIGATVRLTGDDGVVNVRRELKDGVLTDKIWTKKGSRTNAYYPRKDAVVVESTIAAPQLPTPIVFRYTYR